MRNMKMKMKIIRAIVLVCIVVSGGYAVSAENIQEAYFAGGCFWCMEAPFEALDGVMEVISGYAGGTLENPTYDKVSSGTTQYLETVKIVYDADKTSYETLLNVFWRQIDPTDNGGQFVDRGYQYTTAIFYVNEEQKRLSEASKKHVSESGWFEKPIVTVVRKFTTFYPAEQYHQDYYKKNPIRYKYYSTVSGRPSFLKSVWKKEADDTDEIPIKKK